MESYLHKRAADGEVPSPHVHRRAFAELGHRAPRLDLVRAEAAAVAGERHDHDLAEVRNIGHAPVKKRRKVARRIINITTMAPSATYIARHGKKKSLCT